MRGGSSMGKSIGVMPCPKCRSEGRDRKGNNLIMYDNGSAHCFACGYDEQVENEHKHKEVKISEVKDSKKGELISSLEYKEIKTRKISATTCKQYGYGISQYNGKACQVAEYRNDKGQVCAQKLRFADKSFLIKGDNKQALMFGAHLYGGGGKRLVICEGEIDALSLYEAWDKKYQCAIVSVKNGAGGAKNDVAKYLEWIESYETVIFAFDMDEAGRKAAYECAEIVSPHKVRIAHFPEKDINECLVKGKTQELLRAIWEAKPHSPDYILTGEKLYDECRQPRKKGLSLCYPDLENKTEGLRAGELWLFTAGSGIGKSTVVHEIAYHMHVQHKLPIGLICLEENARTTAQRHLSIAMNKNMLSAEISFTDEEYEQAYNTAIKDNFYVYNHFGSQATEVLMPKIRSMVKSLGCKVLVLDHISIVISGLDEKEQGTDERKTIDMFMTNLRSLCEETGVTILAVVHLKRPSDKGKSWNEGRQVSLTDLRGSGALEQLSDVVVALERDQQAEGINKNVSRMRILKNRPTGVCGESDHLIYSRQTGRLLAYNGENPNDIPDFNVDNNKEKDDVPF